ncbi:hypothetical protein [Nocardia abscessus]|uniref:hypothetical protein n=1 Tax=Nocardia abscessus TaxID=120957 RepID=UPI0024569A1A|nr:hypothetical protein [Nocardia abscessus]
MSKPVGTMISRVGTDGCATVRWRIPDLTVETIWRVLCAAFARATDDRHATSVKLLENERVVVAQDRWPHRATSRNRFESWMAAMGGGSGGYLAWARSAQTLDRGLFETLVEAMAAEFGRRGLPSGLVEAELFLGDYAHTPGGIHRETCSNIHLVVSGAKSMHFWNASRWPPPDAPRRVDVADGSGTREEYLPDIDVTTALESANSLTAQAGEGFCWPAGAWHIGQTHGRAMSLNIAAYQRDFDAEPSMRGWSDGRDGEVAEDWLVRYRDHIGGDVAPAALLARVSALGMRPARPVRGPRRGRRGHWRLDVPLLWTMTAGRELFIATLGAVRREECAVAALDWLSERRDAGTESDVPAELEGLAGWLHEQGAFDVVPADAPTVTTAEVPQ